MMWVAICPKLGPPHACSIAALSMIRLAALRTWMSSNGGVAQFMVMYVVTSLGLKWIRFFLAGWVRYCCRMGLGGWLVNEASRAPDWTLLKMSLTLVSMVIWMPSTLLVRRLSVAWSSLGLRTMVICLLGSKPEIAFMALQEEMFSLSEPLSM